jgi:multimeric flavodoxin WrbA
MKIAVINGTPVRGVTYHMKELFLSHMGSSNEIIEFYPKDFPQFCMGCKNCFLRGEEKCPHISEVDPIWQAMLDADLLVFAYPVYALRAPASIKSVLDHLCVHWTVHRPDPIMFQKKAVIITNSVGAPNGSAQKDVRTSMAWMGVSKIYTCGAPMMGDIFLDKMSQKHLDMLTRKTKACADRVSATGPVRRKSLKARLIFAFCKWQHSMVLKHEETPSLDNAHYIRHGWIRERSQA